jgi:hypothetical protein
MQWRDSFHSFLMCHDPKQEFSGRWVVEPCAPGVPGGPSLATNLRYEIAAVPQLSISSALVAYVLRCGLPANLTAIARRAEQVRLKFAPKLAPAVADDQTTQDASSRYSISSSQHSQEAQQAAQMHVCGCTNV